MKKYKLEDLLVLQLGTVHRDSCTNGSTITFKPLKEVAITTKKLYSKNFDKVETIDGRNIKSYSSMFEYYSGGVVYSHVKPFASFLSEYYLKDLFHGVRRPNKYTKAQLIGIQELLSISKDTKVVKEN